MSTKSPHSTLRLREMLTRQPEIIEPGLMIVDSEFSVFEEPPLDLIAQDNDGTLTLITARDQNQGIERTEGRANVIEHSVFYWHLITDFREDFLAGVRKLSGRKVKRQPPRILMIAPSFSEDLLQLAAYVTHIQTLELFTLEMTGDGPVLTKVELPEESTVTDEQKTHYELQHGEKIAALAAINKDFFENPKVHPYEPVSVDEHIARVNESQRETFSSLLDELRADSHLRVHPQANRIAVIAPSGLHICHLVIGPGGGFTADLFAPDPMAANGIKSVRQFGADDIADLTSAMSAAKKSFA